jgi:hypothetical protein
MMDSGGFVVGSFDARVWTVEELRSLPGGWLLTTPAGLALGIPSV